MNIVQLAAFGAVFLVLLAFIMANVDAAKHRRRYLDGGMDLVDEMTQSQFGKYLAGYFSQQNYTVTPLAWLTDRASAFLISKDGITTFIFAQRSVEAIEGEPVRLVVEQAKFHSATEIMVITNCFLSLTAEEIARAHGIQVLERHAFIHRMGKAKIREIAEQVTLNN